MSPTAPTLAPRVGETAQYSEKFLLAFFVPSLLLASGAFVLYFSGEDLSSAREFGAGSITSQLVLGTCYLIAAFLLITSRRSTQILLRAWPVLLLPALAIVSTAWSADPALTLRRAFALLGIVLFGLSLSASFSFQSCISVVTRALASAMLLSIVWVVLFPAYGLHQATDAVQAVHAGLWRGIFAHRNILGGAFAGITLTFLLVYGRYAFKNLIVRLGAIAVTLACLVGANSGTGYVIAVAMPLFAFSMAFVATQPPRKRLQLLLVVLIAIAILLTLADELGTVVLQALGKQTDLTGRTIYWYYIIQLLGSDLLLGHGYSAGLLVLDQKIGALTNATLTSAHNGYLELLIYFGFVGLAIAMLVLAWLLWGAIRLVVIGPSSLSIQSTFPVVVVVFALAHNVVESSFVVPNSLVTLLLAVAAGMLARVHDAAPILVEPLKTWRGASRGR